MALIILETMIAAPVERVFDLSRDIDFHKYSVSNTQEEAIAGVTSGLINLNETVTWRAKHLGFFQKMTVEITAMQYPGSFTDEMLRGPFRSMKHIHQFEATGGMTLMKDRFEFEAGYGFMGKLVEVIFLRAYLRKLLLRRNAVLKTLAESGE